jgi:AmmeMemoRadiSam system protein A
LLQIARCALLEKLSEPPPPQPADPIASELTAAPTDPELTAHAGCFVSLHDHSSHRLRGCVGRLDPQLPLWDAVRQTAGDVLADPRFVGQPVTLDDVIDLEIEVSVLSAPRLAASPTDFDLLGEGVYLVSSGHAGFFLPQVARETGWSREQLLERLCTEKLGMPADTWRKPETRLYTFRVEVVGPERV